MDERNEAFARLLTLYMRRIRASAAGVAAEIGISRESVNNWRNGISLPSSRNRDRLLACAHYLRLTEAETNRLLSAAGFASEFPLQDSDSERSEERRVGKECKSRGSQSHVAET